MEMTIRCQRINEITNNGGGTYYHQYMKVSLEDVHVDKLLNEIGLEQVIDYYINAMSTDKLLDEIGIEYVKEHFGLIEPSSSETVNTGSIEAILKGAI